MASVLAKKKLLDIAQGMGKKKDEEELRKEQFVPKDDAQVRAAVQQSNREKVLNQLKNNKLAGASVNAGAQTAATAVNSYAQNRNDIQDLNTKIADTERYMQIKYPHIPVERTTWTHEGQKRNVSEDAREVRDHLRTLYNQRNSKQSAVDLMDQKMPSVGKEYDAVRNTLNSANKAAVNPYGDAQALRFDAAQLRGKAATYEPGSWQAEKRGKKDIEVASNLVYQAGVIEDPAKALEETNADIAKLEDMRQKESGGMYMGYSLKDIETALENAYKKRTLLEGKTYVPENAAPWRPARTDEDFLSGLDDNAMHALQQFGIPEGTTYADYDLDDWQDTIHLGSAEAVHDYYARKRVDPEGAAAWLDAMMPYINENRARKQVENAAELTERMPITANVLATGANLLQPVGSLYTIAQQVTGQDVDPNSKWFGGSRFAGAVHGTTENMIEEAAKKPAWEKVLKTTYKVGTSILDNAARMLLYRGIGIGGNAGTAAMAFGTYGDNVSQAIESGATQGEAALVGAIQAGLEYATEWIPTNTYMRLLDSKDAKGMRAIMHDVKEAVLGDGFGEAANSAIGTAAENWIIENGGSIDEAADLYMFRGEAKDYEEAVRMAWKDAMGAALYEGMIGALSAGLISGVIDAEQSGSAQVQKWLDNRKATKQAAQNEQQTKQAAPEAETPAQEAPAEEMGKVTLESMAQEMAAQSAPKPAAKVTVQTPQEYAEAQDLKEKAQKAKETKPVLLNGGAVVTAADNGYTVEKDGQSVNMEDLDAQSKEARMLNAAPDMTQDAANDMLSRYDEQGDADAQDYAKGYKAVYDAALNGKTLEDAQGLYADELTDAQRQSAYQMGVQARTVENTRTEHLTRQIASRNGFRARTSGDGVSLENVTSNLSAEEVNTFKLLDAFGKRFGLSIQIYDTLAGGRANASYQEGTNVVKIARDAEGGAIVRAASHEVYHYLESFSKEDAQKIRDFVLDKLQNNEEFDLDGLRNEYAARYANVQGADVDAEIVADSLLDVIGTEENIKAMAKDNPSLLSRIVDVIQKIREFLRGQLERLAGNSELVDAILQDEEMLSQIQSMAQQGLENARANRDAGSRVTEMAMQDADVQEYMADLGNAENDAERANMLESLAQKKYAATQASVYAETGDYEGGYEAWRQALKDFADQKGALNALLKDAGLATTQSQQENAVLALIGRELKRVDEAGVKYSYAGEKAETANRAALEEAKAMRDSGVDSETIRKQTGWFVGMDGKWRWEIDDSGMEYAQRGDLGFKERNADYRRYRTLVNKGEQYMLGIADAPLTASEEKELKALRETWGNAFRTPGRISKDAIATENLEDYLKHDELFKAYPWLKTTKLRFEVMDENVKGWYSKRNNAIVLNEELRRAPQSTIVHEIQHAIQLEEGFTRGGSRQYWNDLLEEGAVVETAGVKKAVEELRKYESDPKNASVMEAAKQVEKAAEKDDNGKAYDALWAEMERTGMDKRINRYYELQDKVTEERAKANRQVPSELYYNTAGEIEARDAASRWHMGRFTRNMMTPDLGNDDTVFVEDADVLALEELDEKYGVENTELFDAAKKTFGTTYNWNETGYVLPDGTRIDMSGKRYGSRGGSRTEDHRDIVEIYDNYGDYDGNEAMIDFMRRGAIRISPEGGGINLQKMPTKAQLMALDGFISKFRGEVYVDLDDENGNTIASKEYDRGTFSRKVIADLPMLFEKKKNSGSIVAQFHDQYSQKADDANFFAGMYDDAEVRDAGKLIMRLERMRREKQFTTGEWKDETGKIAKKLLEETHSGMNQGALTRKINTMFRAMDQGNVTPNQLMEYAYGIAEKVAEGAGEEMQMDDGAQKARSYIRSHRIYLNDDMQSEVRAQYGDLRSFYSKHFGTAKFTTDRKATSLEDMWSELNEMHPGYFPADAHASEMPELLSKFLEVTGKVNRNYHGVNEQQLKQDVAMRLFWEYYKLPGTYGDQQAKMKEMVDQFGDMLDSLRESYQVRLKQSMDEFRHREEKQRQRNMLERSVKAMTKRLLKPTKNQHIPEEMRGAVATMLELVNTSGSKKGQEARTKAYAQLQAAIAELRKTDVGYAYVDPDMEAYLQELKEKSGNKSVMSMNLQELKDLNKVVSGIRHACTVADQLLTAGHKGSVAAIADDARSALDSMKDRKVRSDLATMATRFGKYAMEDAPRFFRDMARYTGKAGKALWDIVRHGGLDKQITLLKEAEEKLEEIRSKYKGYEQWMSRNSESESFITESGEIELTTGQIMALYLLNKRKQARNHIYGIQGNDGGIAQKRVNTKNGARESVRPSKVNEAQVDYIIGTLTKEQKAFADEMSALLNGWCSDLGNEVSMLMYGYKKYTEKNYFPIEVWGGRKDATSGEERQNQLYLVMNKGFTKEVQDKAQAPLVIPDMFDAVTEHINGMIVYNAWTAPVTDMIKFINHKFRDDSVTMDQNGMEVFAPGQNIIGTVKEDLSRVMGEGAERWYVQLIEDINGLAKNKVEKDVTGFINKLTRNFKATAVGYNIGTMLKQPTSVIRAFDVIPPLYFAGKPVVPNKERQAIMEKYAPIVTWKGYGNFTMDTGKSIERILFPESSTKMERFNEWGMAGAGYMDTVTWHNIWAAAERMTAKQNKDLQRGTDAFYKKTAEIFNQCIDQTQTVDSILHRTQLMRQDTAWIKSVTTFMGEPMKSYNMLMDAVNAWKTQSTKERARTVSKAAGIFAVNAATAAFVNSLISALRNWDDEDPFWQQVWQKMFGQYDEDMTTSEKFMEAIFGSNLAGELNILNYIPIARDIVETFAGYDVERVDMSLFADVRDAVEALKNEKTATPEKIMDLVGALASFVGIPVNNVMMESKRIWNWYNRQMEVFGLDTLDSQYAYLRAQKNIGASGNLTDYANLLLKAEAEGRTDLVKKIRQDMLEAGAEADNIDSKMYKLQVEDLTGIKNASYEKTYAALGAAMKAGDKNLQAALTKELKRAGRTDEQIESGLVNWLKEDPRVISAAQKALAGDVTLKARVVKELRNEGFPYAGKAVNQLQNKLESDAKNEAAPKTEKKKEPEYDPLYSTYDLQTAIENGSDVDDIMEDLRKQGKSDTSIKSSLTSAIKPVYIALMNGTASDKQQAKKLKQRLMQLDLENKYTSDAIDKWLKEDTKK